MTDSMSQEFEVAKVLFHHSHIEAQLFWQRNNFFFLANTALLGSVFFALFINSNNQMISQETKVAVCIAGIVSSAFWLMMNKASKDLNHSLAKDLEDVIKNDEYLKSKFINTYKKRLFSATKLNHWFICCFILAWFYILIAPVVCS